MASDGGGEEDFLDMWSSMEFASLEQLLSVEVFPMAEASNDGHGHPGFSGAQGNNAQTPSQQSAQTAVATPHAQVLPLSLNDGHGHSDFSGAQGNNSQTPNQQSAQATVTTSHAQGNSNGTLESFPALNLNLEKTIYFHEKAEALLSKGQVDGRPCESLGLQKFKATSVPFCLLRIGTYEIRPRYQSELIAKWYYTKKRLNWEILENGLKKKIEISWSDISAIRVKYDGNVEILEIELYEPPHFYREIEIIAKKHTSWKPSSDFTNGQACTYRRHYLEFPQGTLERNMEPLFLLDSRLRELARRPFSSWGSPFFVGDITDAPQSAPPLINSELIQLHQRLHHQLPLNHSSVPTCSADDELMNLIQQYKRRSANHQMPSLKISPASQVSDYGYAPSSLLPINVMNFNGQLIRPSPGEHNIGPSSDNPGKGIMGTSQGHEGYSHNSNLNRMMATKDPSYMSAGIDVPHQAQTGNNQAITGAGINVTHHAHTWNNQTIFNQEMGYHSGLVSSWHVPGMNIPSNSCFCPITSDHAGQGSHEEYNNNEKPCTDNVKSHYAHAQDGLIYPVLASNHDHGDQDHQLMVGYNTANFLPNK